MKEERPHPIPETIVLSKILKTKIATIYFYGNFVVVEAREGVTLSYKTGFSILLKGLQLLRGKPWIYISNRVHSYAVNPTDYKYLNRVPTLKGIAVVNYTEAGKRNAQWEATFTKKPYAIFDNVLSAYEWGKAQLEKNTSTL